MQIIETRKNLLKWGLIAGLIYTVGILSGWLGFLMFGNIAGACEVVFISKEAIVKMEEARVGNLKDAEASMFYGKPETALYLIDKVAGSFENKRTKVLFVSTATGGARGGESISGSVHKEIIRKLEAMVGENGQANTKGN